MPRRRHHGQGTILLRGQTYHLQINHNGRKVSRSLKTQDPDEAQRRAQAYLQQFRLLNGSPTTSFDSAATKEIQRIETDIGHGQAERARHAFQAFAAFSTEQNLQAIDARLVEDFQRHRLQTRSLSTVDKDIGFLRRLLRENGYEVKKPSSKRGRTTVIRSFSYDELVRLFAHVTEHCRCLYATLLHTGARPTELVPSVRSNHKPLRKTEVHFENHTVLIRTAKGHLGVATRPRLVAIPEELAEMLAKQIASNPGPYVFPSCSNLARNFDATLERAGIEKVTPDGELRLNSLRHAYGTFQAGRGVQANILSGIMGHSRPSTTQRYIDASQTTAPILAIPLNISGSQPSEENANRPEIGGKIGGSPTEKPAEQAG